MAWNASRVRLLLSVASCAAACRAPAGLAPARAVQEGDPGLAAAARPAVREADRILEKGIVLRPHAPDDFGLSLRLPFQVTWTEFDLIQGIALDQLATVAVVPTFELVFPLGERWTLTPFVGLGGAYQNGDSDLVGGQSTLGLWNSGVRATRWQNVGERYWFGLMGDVAYVAAMTGRDGVLGDWGSLDGALELRRDFGAARGAPRFQGGVYLQGFYYWDSLELDIAGIDSASLSSNAEIGISLGTTARVEVLGFGLPRVFIGAVLGDLLSGVRIRFGRL